MAIGYEADVMISALREDYNHVRTMLDDIQGRARAAIVDVVSMHGTGSAEHIRLRYVLSGVGEGAASESAVAVVAEHERQVREGR
jgi:hypothetical protein